MSAAGAAPAPPVPGAREAPGGGTGAPGFPEQLRAELRSLGCHVRLDWVEAWLCDHEAAMPSALHRQQQQQQRRAMEDLARKCLGSILASDLKSIGEAALPRAVAELHESTIQGQLVLQADEIVDVSLPTKLRYGALPTPANPNQASAASGLQLPDDEDDSRPRGHAFSASPAHRCLKLSLTDGHQQVAGFEYRPVPALKVDLPAGTKVVLRDVAVRRGILLLMPETVQVLGGQVAELEAARQRLLAHLASAKSRPPLSILTRNRQLPGRGNQSTDDFAQAATRAAWPQSGTGDLAARAGGEADAYAPAAHLTPRAQNQPAAQQERGQQERNQQARQHPGSLHSMRAQRQSEAQLRHEQGVPSNGIVEHQFQRDPSSSAEQRSAASGAGTEGRGQMPNEAVPSAAQDNSAQTRHHPVRIFPPQPDVRNEGQRAQNRGAGGSWDVAPELEVLDDELLEQEWERQMEALEGAEHARRQNWAQGQGSTAAGRKDAQDSAQVATGGGSADGGLERRGGKNKSSNAFSRLPADVPLVDLTRLSQEPPESTELPTHPAPLAPAAPSRCLSDSAAPQGAFSATQGREGRKAAAVGAQICHGTQNGGPMNRGARATGAHELTPEDRAEGGGAWPGDCGTEVTDSEELRGSCQAGRGNSDVRENPFSADNNPAAKRPRAEGHNYSSVAGAMDSSSRLSRGPQGDAGSIKEASKGRWPLLYLSDVTPMPSGAPGSSSDEILRVKCAVIGVKEFRHLRLQQLHLSVFLDDGVTVTPAMIQAQEVERLMGLSKAQLDAAMGGMRKGSPAASAAAAASASGSSRSPCPSNLSSPPEDLVRRSLQQMQTFLANFEGTADILRPLEAGAPLTVVRLIQGCADLDIESLATRSRKAEV